MNNIKIGVSGGDYATGVSNNNINTIINGLDVVVSNGGSNIGISNNCNSNAASFHSDIRNFNVNASGTSAMGIYNFTDGNTYSYGNIVVPQNGIGVSDIGIAIFYSANINSVNVTAQYGITVYNGAINPTKIFNSTINGSVNSIYYSGSGTTTQLQVATSQLTGPIVAYGSSQKSVTCF
jgi:hypothetical protein